MSIEAIKKLEFAYQTMEAASQRIDELKAENAALRQAIEQAQKQRQWVELTPEEVVNVANAELSPKSFARGAAWANAKLKEKNT